MTKGKHGIGSPFLGTMTTESLLAYRCSYEYLDGENECRRSDIVYQAKDPADAVDSARRWLKARMAIVPEFFKRVLYFEISPYPIGPITEAGQLQTGGAFRLMEWSQCRAGVDMETYCDWKIAEYSLKNKESG